MNDRRATAEAKHVSVALAPRFSASAGNKLGDLEIKDAQLIFQSAWDSLVTELGAENLRFPKEIILLGGAPGSGKGTHTAFISRTRGLTCPPVVVSALLNSPAARAMKDAGHMVGDREVVELRRQGARRSQARHDQRRE